MTAAGQELGAFGGSSAEPLDPGTSALLAGTLRAVSASPVLLCHSYRAGAGPGPSTLTLALYERVSFPCSEDTEVQRGWVGCTGLHRTHWPS